jgi:hypothetical protein
LNSSYENYKQVKSAGKPQLNSARTAAPANYKQINNQAFAHMSRRFLYAMKGMMQMNYIDADELRERVKNSAPTPYDAKFCAMINELVVETGVDENLYLELLDDYRIINEVNSVEKINQAIDWIMGNDNPADLLTELRELIELRRKIVRGID